VTKVFLSIAAIVDLALAVLLVVVSGFMIGHGPESMNGGTLATVGYFVLVGACVAAPAAGFVFNRYGKAKLGIVIAWLPAAGALLALVMPSPY
jgi:hypothetical protein